MPGDVVYEVTPEDDGWVSVRTESGEKGEIPTSCLSMQPLYILYMYSERIYNCLGPKLKEIKIGKHQKLRGTRVFLHPGDVVYVVPPDEEGDEDDGWITVKTNQGDEGEIPISCIDKGINVILKNIQQ